MKKHFVLVILTPLILMFLLGIFSSHLPKAYSGQLRFDYSEEPIQTELKEQECIQIRNQLNHKLSFFGPISDDFGEDVSIKLIDSDGTPTEYWLSYDASPVVYVPQQKRYIVLPRGSYEPILEIVRSHGFFLPCY